jgi:carbohydrate-selective porin OprB
MPTVANGITLDTDIGNARGDNLEFEIKYGRRETRAGTVRLLLYQNHANMGSYDEALAAAGPTGVPDITATRRAGRVKRGFGVNVTQQAGPFVRLFGRLGANDGDTESFAYTEVDNTVEVGADLMGVPWRRPLDKVGAAFVTNGLWFPHREYLRRGGLGFILGDGNLDYGRELIGEQYYNFHVWGGAFAAEGLQLIGHPGYNRARGPVWVLSLRGHLEF